MLHLEGKDNFFPEKTSEPHRCDAAEDAVTHYFSDLASPGGNMELCCFKSKPLWIDHKEPVSTCNSASKKNY